MPGDGSVGLDAPITPGFLGSTLLASGAALLTGATPIDLLGGRDKGQDNDGFTGMAASANTECKWQHAASSRSGPRDPRQSL